MDRVRGRPPRPRTVEVVTADANDFEPGRRFDRVLSVEMLEHMRNYEALLARIAGWLEPDGRLFVHVFSHRRFAYPYERGWMARNVLHGGTMPSHDLLPRFAATSRSSGAGPSAASTTRAPRRPGSSAWTRTQAEVRASSPTATAPRRGAWLPEWRVFFLACAELWGFRGGREWGVSHYLFAPA